MTHPLTHNLGFPRIGADRELKKALEAYWRGDLNREQLESTGRELRRAHWQLQADAGLDLIPTGDFAWYDQVLTLSATLGNIPARHRNADGSVDIDVLFRMARGRAPTGTPATACEMTKWFDTNYHYLVPEFSADQRFALSWTQIIDETREAVALGHRVKPVLLGPLSYLYLGKEQEEGLDRLTLLDQLLPVYRQLLQALVDAGAEWIQIDEPILVLDLPTPWRQAFEGCYHNLQNTPAKLLLATYFGGLEDNLSTALELPVAGLHIDAVRAPGQLLPVLDRLSGHKVLSVGVVDGRNIWRNDLQASLTLLQEASQRLGERLWLAPSCSLLHSPVDLERERDQGVRVLDPAGIKDSDPLISWLAFAKQKVAEVVTLAQLLRGNPAAQSALEASNRAAQSRRESPLIHKPEVQQRPRQISEPLWQRQSPFATRIAKQQALLQLPLFPTTTIGSFPQTTEIRQIRRDYKQLRLSAAEYNNRIRQEIADTIARQEQLGIDMLVHGEAERNDMVEYFGEQLDGFAFTRFGWVQSYGSRCVKPPIIYGDVSRPSPITVQWARYAQSLSDKPVKGMLTGPITMLCWSFERNDQPAETTATQIALALRDEVLDLEAAGIRAIQIDEPAIREGLPLRDKDRAHYLDWAVKAFRISAAGVQDDTQIHTHMCYSEFNDIIANIAALDADVITIETSRSHGELLQAFEDFEYPNDIGPGVYDIHSPNVPEVDTMVSLLKRAARNIPAERLWVNPDCGLKTRGWPETEAALKNMVEAAKVLRETYAEPSRQSDVKLEKAQ